MPHLVDKHGSLKKQLYYKHYWTNISGPFFGQCISHLCKQSVTSLVALNPGPLSLSLSFSLSNNQKRRGGGGPGHFFSWLWYEASHSICERLGRDICYIIDFCKPTSGEFGLVYKAHLLKPPQEMMRSNVDPQNVAVKTLKGWPFSGYMYRIDCK